MVLSNSIIVVINPFSQEVCVVKPSMACDLCYSSRKNIFNLIFNIIPKYEFLNQCNLQVRFRKMYL